MKYGVVGLVGNPNSGKSTLLNLLVGEEISIVTSAPQTTRKRLEGLWTTRDTQIVLLDAPGFVEKKKGLFHFLSKEFESVLKDSDVVLAVTGLDEGSPEALERTLRLAAGTKKVVGLVIMKVDLMRFRSRLAKIKQMAKTIIPDVPIFEFSTTWGKADTLDFTVEILKCLQPYLHEVNDFPHDPEDVSLQTVRELCAERIRKELFELLQGEIPFGMAVYVRTFEEKKTLTKIEADLWVIRDSHKKIVVGSGGKMIKDIGIASRKSIEKWLGSKVHLELHVLVKEDWALRSQWMKELGYVRH